MAMHAAHDPACFRQGAAEQADVVIDLAELPERFDAVEHAERLAQRAKALGAVALNGAADSMESFPQQAPISLAERVRAAAAGSEDARKSVRINAQTDLQERAFKAGHVTSVELAVDADGHIVQYGQQMDDVHSNAMGMYDRSANQVMYERSMAEAANSAQQEYAYQRGDLKDNYFVVVSRPDDRLSEAELSRQGFFVDTMSMVVQVMHQRQDDTLELLSYFVAGRPEAGAPRDDAAMTERLGVALGQDWRDLSATELLSRPVLVPKGMLSGGPSDLVRAMDRDTFYGLRRPAEDYAAYEQECQERQASFESMADDIAQQMVDRAAQLHTQEDATAMLAQLSQDALVHRAAHDTTINPAVFGEVSARHIVEARAMLDIGEYEAAQRSLGRAQATAVSSSCPGGARAGGGAAGAGVEESSHQDCEFTSLRCPECGKSNVRTTVSRLDATHKVISGDCGCMVVAKDD
ncbi:hypothetical protein CR970_00915 [Candidatus Saccharibacteria bacterium]|nr:MAG: hypothetical protein CR970_00915 [Candidatus Saccharibacteria bacterium]